MCILSTMGNVTNAERMDCSPIHQPTKECGHVQLVTSPACCLILLFSSSTECDFSWDFKWTDSISTCIWSLQILTCLYNKQYSPHVSLFILNCVCICMHQCDVCVCPWVCDTETRGKPSCWCLPSNSFEMGPLIVHQWICPASWPVNIQGLSLPASHVCNSWMASLCTDLHGFGSAELRSSHLSSKCVHRCTTFLAFFLHSYATLHPLPLTFYICRFNS